MREDWTECLLGDISTKITKGSTPTTYGYKYQKEGINFIKIENVIKGRIDLNSIYQFISKEAHDSQKRSQLEEGDVLFSIAGTIGETCLITNDVLPANTNQAFAIISGFNKVLDANFLRKQLDSFVSRKLKDKARGGAMNNVSLTDLKELNLVVPPLVEQNEIINKIEELFSDLDKGISDLKKAQDQLVIFRQAVLKKAFEGELTIEWREQQTNLPTADGLLKQIKEERQKHHEQRLKNWKQAVKTWEKNGKEGKKPRKPNPKVFLQIDDNNFSNLFNLPSNWKWIPMGNNVSEIVVGYVGPVKKHITDDHINGVRFLSTTHIGSNGFKNHDIRYITSDFDKDNKKSSVKAGDILVARHGDSGKSCLVPDYIEKAQVSNAVIVRGNIQFQDLTFMVHCFNFLKHFLKDEKVGGVQQVVNTKSMEAFPYPLLSIKEQHQIVKEIESRLSVCDKVEKSITESLEKAKALRQSILKKAFDGTLLSAEEIAACKAVSDYEPASVLLEKIKAEKTNNKKR